MHGTRHAFCEACYHKSYTIYQGLNIVRNFKCPASRDGRAQVVKKLKFDMQENYFHQYDYSAEKALLESPIKRRSAPLLEGCLRVIAMAHLREIGSTLRSSSKRKKNG